jgi:hypothetical protein
LDRFSDVFEGDPEIGIVNKILVDKGLFHNLIPLSSSQKSCVSRILTTGFVFIPNMTDFHFEMHNYSVYHSRWHMLFCRFLASS